MSGSSWLDPPEAAQAFQVVITDLISESDRGATLIAADMVSNHLDMMFERRAPEFLKSRVKKMIAYPGVAATLSAKADIAAVNGWIGETPYRSIGHLRRIRNKAAHSDRTFSLKDEEGDLKEMLNLGENVPAAIHTMALEILIYNLFERLRLTGEDLREQLGENPFGSSEKIAEELQKRPDWSSPLEERLPRLKLGLGVCLTISLMALTER